MASDEDRVIAEGLASVATALMDLGGSAEQAAEELVHQWRRLGSPAGAFAASALEVARQPQPLKESAAETERMRMIRERLGMPSTEAQLLAAMRARELLEGLAAQFG